jgi:RND family efflux transporter, MFP subunit
MKKKYIIFGSAAILLAVVVLWKVFSSETEANVKIDTAVVSKGNITNSVTATGTIEPIEKVEVGTQVSGVIDKLYVDFNSQVKKGQIMAELDKSTLLERLRQTKASLEAAQNEQNYQTQNFTRISKLHDSGLVSDTDFETAQYSYKASKANADGLESQLRQAQVNLAYATIYSPIDGIVLSRAVEQGQTVAASFSTPTLFTIANDLTKMQVEANVDQADIGQVSLGQRVTFTVDAYPDDTFKGTVTQIRLQATTTSNVVTYTVIVNAPNPELKLKPGLTANITIITKEKDDVLLVPAKALRYTPTMALAGIYKFSQPNFADSTHHRQHRMGNRNGGDSTKMWKGNGEALKSQGVKDSSTASHGIVYVLRNDTIFLRHVKMGMDDGAFVEIERGLHEGDTILVGQLKVTKVADNAAQSPFMPKMPKRGGSKNSSERPN